MLWRVRTALPDRPGALAVLAQNCGAAGVNILGLQIFPDMGSVTDELVLRTPADWGIPEIGRLVELSGGRAISSTPCTEAALTDQPTRFVQASRAVLAQPASFPAVVAQLFDAEADPVDGEEGPAQDVMEMTVGDVQVQVRRTAPFTATEHARAVAFAEVAASLLGGVADAGPTPEVALGSGPDEKQAPVVRVAGFADTAALMRMHQRCSTDSVYRRYAVPLARIDDRFARRLLTAGGGALVAAVGAEVVGLASVSGVESGVAEVSLLVEDGWQRRGLGTRLLTGAARLARGHGADEVVLRSPTHNPALMSLAFASGLRARIRLDGDAVVVTVGVDGLRPLTAVPDPAVGAVTPGAVARPDRGAPGIGP